MEIIIGFWFWKWTDVKFEVVYVFCIYKWRRCLRIKIIKGRVELSWDIRNWVLVILRELEISFILVL